MIATIRHTTTTTAKIKKSSSIILHSDVSVQPKSATPTLATPTFKNNVWAVNK